MSLKNKLLSGVALLSFAGASLAQQAVLQRGNDPSLSGANLSETKLNVSNVNPSSFGVVAKLPVDADVYAQPLYVPNVAVAGQGTHNVLYVASMNDTLYAFDADTGAVLWSDNFAISVGATPAPIAMFTFQNNQNIVGNVGILGTPVIDASTNLMYLVACTLENGTLTYRLHAVDITTGTEPLTNVVVSGTYGTLVFDGRFETERVSLTLAANQVVFAFGAVQQEYSGGYSGWVMAYDKRTLAQTGRFATGASGTLGAGVWQSGRPPAVDSAGYVYLFTGNGYTGGGYNPMNGDYSETVLKLNPADPLSPANHLTLADSFTPSNWSHLDDVDQDLASSGPMLVPNTTLLAGGGKSGTFYLLNTAGLGGNTPTDVGQLQTSALVTTQFRGGPVYWQRSAANGGPLMYHWGSNYNVRAYSFNGSTFVANPQSQGSYSPVYPGGTLSISANADTPGTGILWATVAASGNLYNDPTDPGVVYAMDANSVSTVLWSSTMNSSRDALGNYAKFVPPTVANGKVYVATFSNQVVVYGQLPTSTPTLSPAPGTYTGPQQVTIADTTPGAVIHYTTDGSIPTGASPIYVAGASIPVNATETLQAIGITTNYLNSAVAGGTYTISAAVSGSFTVSPTTLAFGSQALGTSTPLPVTLQNTGTGALPITSIAFGGGAATQFSQSNTCGTSVASGASCSITVAFNPTNAGAKSSSLSVTSGTVTHRVAVSGTAAAAAYTVAPSTLTFAPQAKGVPSPAQSVSVTNTGSVGLPITAITVSGAQSQEFSEFDNCVGTLAPGASCGVQVTFLPTASGAKSTSLKVTTAGGAKPQTVAVTGTGTIPTYTLNPTTLTFEGTAHGTSSAPLPVTVTNTGTSALPISSITNTGVFSQTNNCGASVAVGATCTINVIFSPTNKAPRTGTLKVTSSTGAAIETVALAGTGT